MNQAEKETSEFGKGLVYNLVLFANHFSNDQARKICRHHFVIQRPEKIRRKILTLNPLPSYNYGWNKDEIWWWENIVSIYDGDPRKALSVDIISWANGATDHLYDIIVPSQWENSAIAALVESLRSKGLKIGHGFVDKVWKYEDFINLKELTKSIAMEIDKALGIDVIKAEYE